MKIRIVALGHRMPAWVSAGVDEYVRRLPRELALQVVELKPEPRDRGRSTAQILAAEARRIGDATRNCLVIVLDERGKHWTTAQFAERLGAWRDGGLEVAFVIGSADGLAESVKHNANVIISLSTLTLPHGLTRVLLAEQIYRAASLLRGHPYHRE